MTKDFINNKPVITIGLPVYNAELYVKDCIRSILNQTYSNFELIIVDDGSTDGSIGIVESFVDSRIVILKDGFKKGLANRLNQISQLAKGDYIVRMDSDDIMHKDRIREQLNILKTKSDIDVLGTNAYSINNKNEILGVRCKLNNEHNLVKVNSFIHPTIMGKKEWFKKNPYDEKVLRFQDAELWFRTNEESSFYCLNTPLLFYREFQGGYYKKYFKAMNSMFYVSKKLFKNNYYYDSFNWFINYFLFTFFKGCYYYCLNIIGREWNIINNRNVVLRNKDSERAKHDLINSVVRF